MTKFRVFIVLACIAITAFSYLTAGGGGAGFSSNTSSTPKDSL